MTTNGNDHLMETKLYLLSALNKHSDNENKIVYANSHGRDSNTHMQMREGKIYRSIIDFSFKDRL